MIEYLTSAGYSQQAIDALFKASAATILGLAIAIIMTPIQLRKLRKDLESRSVRIFRKIKRIEDLLLDAEIRRLPPDAELTGIYGRIRADQRDAADERDADPVE